MALSSLIPSPTTVAKTLVTTLAVLVGGGGAALWAFQRRLIYPANLPEGSRTRVPTPAEFGIEPFEDLQLTAADGVRIRAFLMMFERDGVSARDRPTVLLLHANAGNVGHRLPIAKVFLQKMRCNVLALSYRGYGLSEGSPSEQGLKLDAQAALDFILSHPALDKTPIFLYGQSIGGAVAIHLATQNSQRVTGLIIENTFLSLPKLIPHLMPFLSPFLPFLLTEIWPSEEAIARLPPNLAVLFLAGAQDELVEPGQMKRLWALCKSERKEWREFEHGTHNDTCIQPQYFASIATFLASTCNLPLPPAFPDSAAAARPPSTAQSSSGLPPTLPTKSAGGSETEASDASGESFELVERDGLEMQKGGGSRPDEAVSYPLTQAAAAAPITAGSLGPREELAEVKREMEGVQDDSRR